MKDEQVIVIATKNNGKVKEFAHELAKLGFTVKSLYDYPHVPPIIEDGLTFMDNAKIKAKVTANILGVPVLADDSGLCVESLNDAPGVFSARYAGEEATDEQNNNKLIVDLNAIGALLDEASLPDGSKILSRARFVCALALYLPSDDVFIEAEGEVHGVITDQAHGEGGFGYDPYFWLPSLNRGMAQLTKEEKNQISHRGAALKQLLPKLEKLIIA